MNEPGEQGERLADVPLRSTQEQRRSEEDDARWIHNRVLTRAANYLSTPGNELGETEQRAVWQAGERLKQPKDGSRTLWVAVVLLLFALGAETGYGYLTMRQNGMGLSQLPGVHALNSRVGATESKLHKLMTDRTSLSQQVAGLKSKLRSGLESGRRHAEELIMQERERIEAEMAKRR